MQNSDNNTPFFSQDQRLSKLIKGYSSKETLRSISDKIKKLTLTKVNVGDRGLISYAVNESPVWELMEAISAIELAIWKQENRGYKLYEPSWFFDSGYGAQNEYMLHRFQAGMAFISNLEKMPKALQDKIFVPDGTYPGISFNNLPKNLQQNMHQILGARSKEAQAKNNQNLLSQANPKNMTISIEKKPNEHGINSYFFNIECSSPSVSSGFRINDYHNRPGNEASGNFGKNGFTRNPNAPSNTFEGNVKKYIPKKINCEQQIKKKEKFFTQELDLYSDRVTLHRALFLISEKVKFNYVCPNGPPNAKIATVNLRDMTLLESLNALEKAFPGAKWTVRDSGFIVFRQPNNPVDYPEKNPYISGGSR